MEQGEEDLAALMLRNRTAFEKLLHMDRTIEEAAGGMYERDMICHDLAAPRFEEMWSMTAVQAGEQGAVAPNEKGHNMNAPLIRPGLLFGTAVWMSFLFRFESKK